MVCHFLHHQGNPEFTQRRNKNKDFRKIRNVGMVNSTRGEREREQRKPFWNRAFFSPSFPVPPLHFPPFIYIYTKKLFPSTTTDEDGFFFQDIFPLILSFSLSPSSACVNARKEEIKTRFEHCGSLCRFGKKKNLPPPSSHFPEKYEEKKNLISRPSVWETQPGVNGRSDTHTHTHESKKEEKAPPLKEKKFWGGRGSHLTTFLNTFVGNVF